MRRAGGPGKPPPASARSEISRPRSASRDTTTPTAAMSSRSGTRLAATAAKGAAKTPLSTSPAITGQSVSPTVDTKAADTAAVTKDSARLAEPIASRGDRKSVE